MRTEEEVESWYEEEKKKSIEKFLAVLEKKGGGEKAEQGYKKDLNTLFEKYKKLKLEAISVQTKKAKTEAVKKAKQKGAFAKLLERIAAKAKAMPLARLIKR